MMMIKTKKNPSLKKKKKPKKTKKNSLNFGSQVVILELPKRKECHFTF